MNNSNNKILLIGSGPIVIGQGCEFDYSGTQACNALKDEGMEVILINSNPATFMSTSGIASKIYLEPLEKNTLKEIIKIEKPKYILGSMGGQTGLNLQKKLNETGVLDQFGIIELGTPTQTVNLTEDRVAFYQLLQKLKINAPKSISVSNEEELNKQSKNIPYPCLVRSNFSLGGKSSVFIQNEEELLLKTKKLLTTQGNILIEESLLGWKEIELELLKDIDDNVMVIAAIENLDPVGIHTGDSVSVTPLMTISDAEYQTIRAVAKKLITNIGLIAGACNVQFAINPKNGEYRFIEVNARISRSSTLASKATGYPIAYIATQLTLGYRLWELKNRITDVVACLEPSIDYCVVKMPFFNFNKFPSAKPFLDTAMHSIGEVMGIGGNFKEAFSKVLHSFETPPQTPKTNSLDLIQEAHYNRYWYILDMLRAAKITIEELHQKTNIDLWFLDQLKELVELEQLLKKENIPIQYLKRNGLADSDLAKQLKTTEQQIRELRHTKNALPAFRFVDSCAAEIKSSSSYYYTTYRGSSDSKPKNNRKKILIIGSGPNRIGQGLEFDYCCAEAINACKVLGVYPIMFNSNPATISTDFSLADRLYFDPLDVESLLNIYNFEKPEGIIIQFGGQTSLNFAFKLAKTGIPLLGISIETIELCENRLAFYNYCKQKGYLCPSIYQSDENKGLDLETINFPVLVRPSYIIGGEGIQVIKNREDFIQTHSKDNILYCEEILQDGIELDVDLISNGKQCIVIGIIEQVESVLIHSGDSTGVFPPYSLPEEIIDQVKKQSVEVGLNLKLIGLFNIQFVIQNKQVFILEVNPRASRTIPFLSKATEISWAQIALKIILGEQINLKQLNAIAATKLDRFYVKGSIFSFDKIKGTYPCFSQNMKSTGESIGVAKDLGLAYYKAKLSSLNTKQNLRILWLVDIAQYVNNVQTLSEMTAYSYNLDKNGKISPLYSEYSAVDTNFDIVFMPNSNHVLDKNTQEILTQINDQGNTLYFSSHRAIKMTLKALFFWKTKISTDDLFSYS
ncbi:MAG: carbamoyl-phosphate synthase large subunit [Aureispira sp.]|nr:carbamoyl-phosphate synthase large subunit [Aureispira sp.]